MKEGNRKTVSKDDVPAVEELKKAVLHELASGRRRSLDQVQKDAAKALGLSAEQIRYRIKGSKTTLLENRFEKAFAELRHEGMIERPDTGKVKLTAEGKASLGNPIQAETEEEGAGADQTQGDQEEAPAKRGAVACEKSAGEDRPEKNADGVLAEKNANEPRPRAWLRYLPLALAVFGLVACLAGQGLFGAVLGGLGVVAGRKTSDAAASRPAFAAGICAVVLGLALAVSGAFSGAGASAPAKEARPSASSPLSEDVAAGELSFEVNASGWASSYGSVRVSVSGTTENGARFDEEYKVQPGSAHALRCEAGTYTFAVDQKSLKQDDAVFMSDPVTFTFDGLSDHTVTLLVSKDKEATEKLAEAARAQEEEKARVQAEAEAKAQEEAEAAAAEAAAAAEREAAAAQEDQTSRTVYITKTGKKYHSDGCGHLSKSKIPISIKDAQARGLEPCKDCNPGW